MAIEKKAKTITIFKQHDGYIWIDEDDLRKLAPNLKRDSSITIDLIRLDDVQQEIDDLILLILKYNQEATDYEQKVENERLELNQKIRESFKKCAYIDWKGESAFLCTTCPFYRGLKKGCSWKLKGFLEVQEK